MFEQILSEFKNTNQRLDRMENEITGIKSDVSELKTDL